MRKGLLLIIAAMTLSLYSCNTPTEGEGDVATSDTTASASVSGMYLYSDFNSEYKLPIEMLVLDKKSATGMSIPPIVEAYPDDFRWEVIIGDGFHIIIEDVGDLPNELADLKLIQADDVVWEIEYLIDEPELIMYTQALPDNAGVSVVFYHINAFKTIDGVNYVFRTPDQGEFSKSQIEKMLAAIKSVKSVTAPTI